jgi:hypothetical protein
VEDSEHMHSIPMSFSFFLVLWVFRRFINCVWALLSRIHQCQQWPICGMRLQVACHGRQSLHTESAQELLESPAETGPAAALHRNQVARAGHGSPQGENHQQFRAENWEGSYQASGRYGCQPVRAAVSLDAHLVHPVHGGYAGFLGSS